MNYFRNIYNQIKLSDYIKDISTLVGGSLIAQIIAFLSLPLISRLYLPEDFGAYSTFITISGIFGLVSNLLYDRAIVLPKKNSNALGIFLAAIFFSFIIFLVILLIFLLFKPFLSNYLFFGSTLLFLLLPLRVLQLGIFQSSEQVSLRNKKFKSLSLIRSSNSFLTSIFQILSNLLYSLNGGLIFGKVFSDIISSLLLLASNFKFISINIKKINFNSIHTSIKKYLVFPKFQLPSVFFNTCSQGMPIIFLTSFFSFEVAGFYGMSLRLLKQPTELIGSSTQNVFYQRASHLFNNKKSILNLFNNTTITLAKIYFLPMVFIILFAPQIFNVFLGYEWIKAGEISQALVLWCFFSFIKPPAMMTFNILNLQYMQFRIEFVQLVLRIIALSIGYLYFNSYMISLYLFILVSIIVDTFTIFFIKKSIIKNEKVLKINSSNKIAFIISGLGQGGAERVMTTVANECTDEGYDVEIIAGYSNHPAYNINKNIKVHYVGYKRLNFENLFILIKPIYERIFSLKKVINKVNPDILISFGDATNIQSIMANRFLSTNKRKHIISIRSNPEKLHFLTKLFVAIFYNFSNLLVVQTLFVEQWAKKRFKFLKTRQIKNPVKLPELQKSKRDIDFLHVGTIKFEKNHISLIKAFNSIKDKIDENAKLVLVGGIESQNLYRSIIDLIEELDLEKKVIFEGPQKNVNKYYQNSKIFVLPSLYEGMSNSLLEAMSNKLPCITTAYSGSSSVINHRHNGIIVPQNDINALAEAMLDLFHNEQKRNRLGENARNEIEQHYNKKIIIKKWLNTIKQTL